MDTRLVLAITILTSPAFALADDPTEAQLATQAYGILKTHCSACHGVKFEVEGFNVLRRDSLLNPDNGYVVLDGAAGNLEKSLLWLRAGIEKDMPPGNGPRPSDEELAILKTWIEAGAPFPTEKARTFVSEKDILSAIHADLTKAAKEDRRFYRYFSLANLHNNIPRERIGRNGKHVDDADLPLARAALSKLINSLSWETDVVVPVAVDPQQTVLRIDLRDVGWVRDNLWAQILSGARENPSDSTKQNPYPYGLSYRVSNDIELRTLAREITTMAGTELACIRADWFIDTASRPPLYHNMLRMPRNIAEIEKDLDVDVIDDFKNDRIARAGFAESGVSRNNRLVDRHEALYGAYWKSYDFARSEEDGNLFRFPLGPKFEGNEFEAHAFEHDGGEMIFNLPNGMQAYYLADAKGERINAGPIKIVRDLKETGGTAEVINGLSCMACHDRGMKRFQDTIRAGLALSGEARFKVEKLFPTVEKMNELLDQDESRFLTAVEAATAPFLKVGENAGRDIASFREPIGEIARMYQKDLELEEAAIELGFEDPAELQAAIRGNPRLREMGLAPLAQGAAIKRSTWGSTLNFLSPFQRAAHELDRGTPHRDL